MSGQAMERRCVVGVTSSICSICIASTTTTTISCDVSGIFRRHDLRASLWHFGIHVVMGDKATA